jgi:excinuclease ABC subunit C
MKPTGQQVIASRAREAPAGPGVYFMLGTHGELFYVGKAVNLRRRLQNYTRDTEHPRVRRLVSEVREVRWLECADGYDALCREADLIVALTPPFNAAMTQDAYTFVCIDEMPSARGLRFRMTEQAPPKSARIYGVFPHLGKGKASWRAVRSNAGYSALLRLLWVAFEQPQRRFRIPAKARGSSPPLVLEIEFDRARSSMLHDFMSGRSVRLITVLEDAAVDDDVPAFMRRPLEADLGSAQEFYRLGPAALRALRRKHGLRSGPIDRQTFTKVMTEDLREAIGSFELGRDIGGHVGRDQ